MILRPDRLSGHPAAHGAAPAAAECAASDATQTDPLSDVLRTVRLTGALFFLWHVAWPYVTPVPSGSTFAPILLPGAQQIVSYHIVTRGSCWAALIGEPPQRLDPGDILLIPRGDPYVMSSAAQMCMADRLEFEPSLQFFRRWRRASCHSSSKTAVAQPPRT
jgi:hypothetical protein